MRICVVCRKDIDLRYGFKIAEKGEFCGVVIYEVVLQQNLRKNKLKRCIKKLCRNLLKLGVTMCSSELHMEEGELFSHFGIMYVESDGIFSGKRGELALEFAKAYGLNLDFLLIGGKFSDVCRAAKKILSERRQIYISCAGFDYIEENIAEETGACVRRDYPDDVIKVDMRKKENFISWGEVAASFSDFKVSIPEKLNFVSESESMNAIAVMLEICGFLKENEIKIRYFVK